MISLAPGRRCSSPVVRLICGPGSMALLQRSGIGQNAFDGSLFIFRGKRGDYFKAIYWDGTGLWLLAKRLEKGRFVGRRSSMAP